MMQSGIFLLWYVTEMTDAGMPMPALVLRMPMPSYDCQYIIFESADPGIVTVRKIFGEF
jgi:hypothetical protein